MIRLSRVLPTLTCLNETFLDESVKDIVLEGFVLVARRDRDDGRKCGGVAAYACKRISNRIALLEKSSASERVWLVLHSDTGPFLMAVWYRPPSPGEVESIKSFEEELQRLNTEVLGIILVGDLNIHHAQWLTYSSRNSAKGELLRNICDANGLRQIVREPTRGENLLDIALTDVDEVRCKVVCPIADHRGLKLILPISVPRVTIQLRLVWQFKAADWQGLRSALMCQDWSWMETIDANKGAQRLTDHILRLAEFFIPRRWMNERKSTHPWINERILHLVQEKLAAVGPEAELECRKRCSAGIMEEYGKFVMKERSHLQSMPQGAKGWWSRSKRLMQRQCDVSSIPAFKARTTSGY